MMNCPNCGEEVVLGSIFCGNCGIRLSLSTPQPASGLQPMMRSAASTGTELSNYFLIVLIGRDKGKSVPVSNETKIGRDPDNHLVLVDPRVDRHHAVISRRDGECVITDLGSANGVFVNTIRISGSQTLHADDHIRLGDTVIVFSTHPYIPEADVDRLTATSSRVTPTSAIPTSSVQQNAGTRPTSASGGTAPSFPLSSPPIKSAAQPATPQNIAPVVEHRRVSFGNTLKWLFIMIILLIILFALLVILGWLMTTRMKFVVF